MNNFSVDIIIDFAIFRVFAAQFLTRITSNPGEG